MAKDGRLVRIQASELNKRAGELLHDVLVGKRFIVYRHRRPVATLQPLNGCVVSPAGGPPHDIWGFPMGDPSDELEKLTPVQHAMLLDGIRLGRFVYGFLPADQSAEFKGALEDLVIRGFARRSERGTLITGRGMVLREELYARHGRSGCDWRR